jgi:hypothetical protein
MKSDPVAGALVAQPRTPPSGALAAAVRHAANSVGAGSGNLQNSRPSLERRVQGYHFVAHHLGVRGAKLLHGSVEPLFDTGQGGAGHARTGCIHASDPGLGERLFEHRAEILIRNLLAHPQPLDGTALNVSQNPVSVLDRCAGACATAVNSQH